MRRMILLLGCLAGLAGCSTVLGTNVAQDQWLPPNAAVEKLGPVYGSASDGHWLWAVWADKKLYDEAKQDALKQKNADLLIDAKITTTLTSYLALYYKTEISITGTAARLVPSYPASSGPTSPATVPPR